jgi:hypothetical protein
MMLHSRSPVGTPYTVAENMMRIPAMSRIYLNELLIHFDEHMYYIQKTESMFPLFIPTNWLLSTLEQVP